MIRVFFLISCHRDSVSTITGLQYACVGR